MSLLIEDITDESHQLHTIIFEESEISLTLRFYPTAQIWCFDAEYNSVSVEGIKLSAGVLHMRSRNFPFDFVVSTTEGIDPFRVNDFSSGRCKLYLVTREEMETVRDAPVPL